jgi:hypothetical protein
MAVSAEFAGMSTPDNNIVNASTAHLFMSGPLGIRLSVATAPLVNGMASFPSAALSATPLAMALLRPGESFPSGMIWRSGPLTSTSAQAIAGAIALLGPDSFQTLVGQPDPFVATAAQMSAGITVPTTTGNFTMTSATVSVVDATRLQVTGTGDYRRALRGFTLFTIRINFQVTFSIEPSNDPFDLNDFLLVRILDTHITSASGGTFGFLVNPIGTLIFGALTGSITAQIVPTLQRQVNQAVQHILASNNPPADLVITIDSVSLDPSAQTALLTVWAALPESDLCSSGPSGGASLRQRDQQQLAQLRQIRDELLVGSPEGEAYVETLRELNLEILPRLLEDRSLRELVDETVAAVLHDLPVNDLANATLTPQTGALVHRVLDYLHEKAGGEVAVTAAALKDRVDRFVGTPVRTVLHPATK